jgi:TrmH family RNA methyltransferase
LRENGRRVYAAALERDSVRLGEFEIGRGDCVVIGNEGHGLSKETVDECDGTVFIPMADGVESLNAATAAAVLVWEFFGARSKRERTANE